MEEQRSQKICIICIGESQTGKSSFINTLFNQEKAEIGKFNQGISCTQITSPYGPITTTRSGKQVMLIDTQGDNDNRTVYMESEDSRLTKLQQLLTKLMGKITTFNPDKIYIIFTESLQGDTCQLNRNYAKMIQILGDNCMKSILILATKYNPTQMELVPYEKYSVDQRLESLQQQLQEINQNIPNFEIPLMKFHTQLWGDASKFIKTESEEFMKQQERELFNMLQTKLRSYPVQIFKEYNEWCTQRIKELHQSEGIGIKTYTEQTVEYIDTTEQVQVPVRKYLLGFINVGKRMKNISISTKKPKIKNETKKIDIKSEEDVKKIFFSDPKYKQERHQKIQELFLKYDSSEI